MFGNATPYQSVEQLFTQKVRLEFQSSRRYTVVPSDEGVDGIVRGEIQSISLQPVSLNDAQLASRFRVTVVVKVEFEDVKAQKTLWENPALSFSDEYELASPGTRPGRVGVCRQRARGDGSHVHRLRALGRQRHPRGVLTGTGNRPACHSRRNSQTDQERQDRAAVPARGRRSAVAPRSRDRVRERRRRGPAGLQRPELLRQRSDQRRRPRSADRLVAVERAHAADDGAAARDHRARGRSAAGAEARQGRRRSEPRRRLEARRRRAKRGRDHAG